ASAAVDDARSVPPEDRLTAEHIALLAAIRGGVVDGQSAQHRGRVLLAVAQVGRLADEVLVLDARSRHAGLDHVVLGLQLVAVRPVALLETAGRAVHADAAGDQAVRPARLP